MTSASLPVRADAAGVSVRLAASPRGRLYATVPSRTGTVLTLLGARGRVQRGWPVLLERAAGCELDADAVDGSVRAVCTVGKKVRAYALDAAGRTMPGWPVDLPAGEMPTWMSDATRVVDGALHVVLTRTSPASATLVRVTRDGALSSGVRVTDGDAYGFNRATIGPDGTAYLSDLGNGSTIWAFDRDGVRPGFPVDLDGWASTPAFGPGGRIYMAVDDPSPEEGPASSRVVALTSVGLVARGWPVTIPIGTGTGYGDPAGPPFPPVVASDGTVYVTGWVVGRDGLTAYALRPSGARRAGWPYRSREPLRTGRPTGVVCMCEPCAFPDFVIYTPPITGPDDSLLLAQIADQRVAGGNRLVAVRPDGTMMAGWPVTLTEDGSWFASVATGPGGTVFAFAVEPAGTRRNSCGEKYTVHAGTIVALDRHGGPVYTTTLVAP